MKISLTVFKIQSGHDFVTDRWTDSWTDKKYGSYRLMMVYISVKFHENVWNGFQVIERTRNGHCQIPNGGIFPKLYRQEIRFLWLHIV